MVAVNLRISPADETLTASKTHCAVALPSKIFRGESSLFITSTLMGEPSSRSRGGQSDTHGLRCPHCAGPLSKEMETSEWTVSPLIRDSFSMIGSAVGGTAGAFYGFNHGILRQHIFKFLVLCFGTSILVSLAMPIVRRGIKGPMWLHFLIGAPPVIVFSSGCAGLAGGSIPALVQLASSSYHAAVSSSPSQPRSSS